MTKKKLIIILLIANLVLLGAGTTLSAYKSQASGSTSDFQFAKFIVNNEEQDSINIDLSNLNPGDTKTINFDIKNYQDNKNSDVTIEYKLFVKTYRLIPTVIQIKNPSNNVILTCDDSHGSRNGDGIYVCSSSVETIAYTSATTKTYTMTINYPANTPIQYAGQVDYIEVLIKEEASANNDNIVEEN